MPQKALQNFWINSGLEKGIVPSTHQIDSFMLPMTTTQFSQILQSSFRITEMLVSLWIKEKHVSMLCYSGFPVIDSKNLIVTPTVMIV